MNGGRAIVAGVAALWLGLAALTPAEKGAESLVIGRGAAALHVHGGDATPGKIERRLETKRMRYSVGIREVEMLAVRFSVTNRSTEPRTVPVVVSLAPANTVAPALSALAFERHAFSIAGQPILVADTPSRGAILAESAFALRSLTPQETAHVTSATGECRGEMIFDLTLAPGQIQTLGFLCPSPSAASPEADVSLDFLRSLRIDEFFPANNLEGRVPARP